MARKVDIVDFNPSDGLTPLQIKKLNWNFKHLFDALGGVDIDQAGSVKSFVLGTHDLAVDQKATVVKKGTKNNVIVEVGIPAAQVSITDAQVDDVLANNAPTGTQVLRLSQLSRLWAGIKQYVDNAIGAIGAFVLKAGDTMTGSLRMKTSSIDRDGANPSADQASNEYTFYDKDNEQIGKVVCYRRTDGRIDIHLNAINEKSDGTSVTNTFQVRVAQDGTCTYYVSSPANFRSAINAVNKSGDTMTGDMIIDGGSANKSLFVDATNIDVDTNPSANVYVQGLHVRDKDNDEISHFEIGQDSSGSLWHNFAAVRQKVSGTFGWYQCYMKVAKDGTVTYQVHTPLAFRNAISALGRNPVSAELPHCTATSNVFPLVLGNTFANNGAISYQNPAELRTTIGANNASNLTSGTLAVARGGTGATSAANARTNLGVAYTSLYNNATGTNGTVTLSETAANFTHLLIVYKWYPLGGNSSTYRHNCCILRSPNNKLVMLPVIMYEDGGATGLRNSVYKISGTSITFQKSGSGSSWFSSSSQGSGVASSSPVEIVSVMGYKY